MSVSFIPAVDKVAANKEVHLRLHYTDSWSDWPNGQYGNWTCTDTFMMENNLFRDHKPWSETDNFFIAIGIWFDAWITRILCVLTNLDDFDHCSWDSEEYEWDQYTDN